jgi:hypothetical protein
MAEDGTLETRYFYFRNGRNHPKVTVAMVRRGDGAVGYGWAIVGKGDLFAYNDMTAYCKDVGQWTEVRGGKSIARGRAEAALRRGKQIADKVWRYDRPIQRPWAIDTIASCNASALFALVWHDAYEALPKSMQP